MIVKCNPMKKFISLIILLISASGVNAADNDSLLVRRIADNVIASYRIEYVDRATKVVYESAEDVPGGQM